MSTHEVNLMGRENVAQGTTAFYLQKPAGFTFVPGQAVTLELADPPPGDGQGRRTFSLVSAPHEPDLVVATRMRDSAFKRALGALPDGAALRIKGPSGRFLLDASSSPAVFIAGGIGITPFMSMLRQAAKDGWPRPLSLIYSNRRPEDAAFLAELQGLQRGGGNFRLIATMTDMSKSARAWDGETGAVNADLVRRCVEDLSASIYYIVGPPAMVEAMSEMLRNAGVRDDGVRTEQFYGY